MGFLKNAVKKGIADGISKGINEAVGKAVETKIAPKADAYAEAVASNLDQTTKVMNEGLEATGATAEKAAVSGGFGHLGASLDAWKKNAENYATELGKNFKECPECGETNDISRKFCSNCGAKLPEASIADGYVCPKCGKQNALETKFCADCGEVLPAAKEEVEAERAELEAQKAAEEVEAREAANQEKLDELKTNANEVKDKAAEIGGQVAEAALGAAGSLFKKFKK